MEKFGEFTAELGLLLLVILIDFSEVGVVQQLIDTILQVFLEMSLHLDFKQITLMFKLLQMFAVPASCWLFNADPPSERLTSSRLLLQHETIKCSIHRTR